MAAKGRGGGKTPERIVEGLNKVIAEKSVRRVSKETGIAISAISRYTQGVGEPTTATLEKLATYFGVSVAWLRGDLLATEGGMLDFNKVNSGRFLLKDLKTIQDVIEGTCSKETRRSVIEQYVFPSLQRTWEIYRRDWSELGEDERAAIREAFPIMLALGVPIDWTPPADHDDK